jgi:hypothetical protein
MNSAHMHLLLNHLPVLAVAFGAALLGVSQIFGQKPYERLALVVLLFSALVALPVYLSGEPAENVLGAIAPISEPLIESHEEAAAIALGATAVVGALALTSLLAIRRNQSILAGRLVALTVAVSFMAAASMAVTAYLGGKIRHSEIVTTTPSLSGRK